MATSDNSLVEMTHAVTPYAGDDDVPDETFRDTSFRVSSRYWRLAGPSESSTASP